MKIEVLDTTLRDGEQTPGISLNAIKKLRIATKLDEIGVNSIEAGSAITSEGEREAIKLITSQGLNAEMNPDMISFPFVIAKGEYGDFVTINVKNIIAASGNCNTKGPFAA